jgi:hypothetical protein
VYCYALRSALKALAPLPITALWMSVLSASVQADCPTKPIVTVSPQIPPDVCIPKGFPPTELPIRFFDDYSWRAFIAMVWPSNTSHRGQPDSSRRIGDLSVPLVFETFKSEWELFPELPDAPSEWDKFGPRLPCSNLNTVGAKDLLLATFSFSKFGNLGEAGQPPKPLVGTLVSQNRKYVRYSTGFNKLEYDQILTGKLYLVSNQRNVTFKDGALDVKASWMDMTDVPHFEREHYYTREAYLSNPASPATCEKKTVGLLGLHIVQKTPSRPQWIWSTFEHINNVPPPVHGMRMALNNGSGMKMPDDFPKDNQWPPKFPEPAPYNVERKKGIHDRTLETNQHYRNALKGTIWENYQLIMTQWPVPDPPNLPKVNPAQDGKPRHTFPGSGRDADKTAFANTTMETFDQERVTKGCMNCHNETRSNTDFLWSLAVNGVTATVTGDAVLSSKLVPARQADKLSPQLKSLIALIRSAKPGGL